MNHYLTLLLHKLGLTTGLPDHELQELALLLLEAALAPANDPRKWVRSIQGIPRTASNETFIAGLRQAREFYLVDMGG